MDTNTNQTEIDAIEKRNEFDLGGARLWCVGIVGAEPVYVRGADISVNAHGDLYVWIYEGALHKFAAGTWRGVLPAAIARVRYGSDNDWAMPTEHNQDFRGFDVLRTFQEAREVEEAQEGF